MTKPRVPAASTKRRRAGSQAVWPDSRVESWAHFVDLVLSHDFEGWAFRGQQSAAWPLLSSLSRHLRDFVPDHGAWANQEARSIRIFQRKAHHFIASPDELLDVFHCVAHMQHHGAPTRLLDFTKSPFVAAFFALERATGDAAVWALNTRALYEGIELGRGRKRLGDRDHVDPRHSGKFERFYLGNRAKPFVWTGEPHKMNRRLIAQAGTFVVPGVIDRPVDAILATYPRSGTLLKKLVIPVAEVRATAMAALYRMNITHATLFPDLDGLARSIAYELETSWRGSERAPSFYRL